MKTIVSGFLLLLSLLSVEQFIVAEAIAAGPVSVTALPSTVNGKFVLKVQGNNFTAVSAINMWLLYDTSTLTNPTVTNGAFIANTSASFSDSNVGKDADAGKIYALTATGYSYIGTGTLWLITFDQTPGKQPVYSLLVNMLNSPTNAFYYDIITSGETITIKDNLTNSTTMTKNGDVSLAITNAPVELYTAMIGFAGDIPHITNMRTSEDPTFNNDNTAGWKNLATTATLDSPLSAGNGVKTIYLQFKDDSGNIFKTANASILVDNEPPKGTIEINGGAQYTSSRDVTVNLAFTDDSGLDTMQFKLDGDPDWRAAEPYAAAKSLTLPAGDGLKHVWVQVADKLGNVTTKEYVASITLGVGSIVINNGDTYTKSTAVTLNISTNDNTGAVTNYCVSNTSTCPSTSWKSYPPVDNSWTLTSVNGVKTVSVWFKDNRGNVSAPVSDTITLDATPPVNGTLKLTALSDTSIKIDWSGVTDAPSGIDKYNLYYGTAPVSDCSGAALESPIVSSASTKTHSGLTEGTTYYYRLCTTDKAENTNTGATANLKLAGLPTGTVAIKSSSDSNNVYTKTVDVTLDITANDASGVAAYCVSNSTTCTVWITETNYPVTSKPWKLTTGNGVKTVYVWFKDTKGNIKRVSDSITLDTTPPTNGVLKVTHQLDRKLKLSWSGVSDSPSGIKEYSLYRSDSLPYPSCSGNLRYSGTGLSYIDDDAFAENSMHYYRLCATDNAGNTNVKGGATASGKAVTPPSGSITIDTKIGDVYQTDAAYTNTPSVYLTINATDTDGVKSYCVSNTTTCTTWVTASNYPVTQKSWTLTTGNGLKTVYAWFKDNAGNVSPPVSDTITLDATAPVVGKLTFAQPDLSSLQLNWSVFSDALSGMKGYELYHSTTALPARCSVVNGVEKLPYDAGTTYLNTGLFANSMHHYRLCGVDNAGNKSSITASRKLVPELDPPINASVTINNGAVYTKSTVVKLAFSANDIDSKVSGYCISNSANCPSTSWKTLTTPVKNLSVSNYSWTLPSLNITYTVSVWFRDIYGNITPVPTSATITLDTGKPVNGKLTATRQPGALQLDWPYFKDNVSGIKEYRLYQSLTTAVPTYCSGELLYTGTATSFTHTALNPGTLHYYRVCATDNAGNTGTGATVTAKAVPELGAPNGSVVINKEGDIYANTAVTLTINATDTSGVKSYCVSNTFTCLEWTPATTNPVIRKWALLAGKDEATRIVNVWFKDKYGIVTPDSVWDEVQLDVTPPNNGTLGLTQISNSELKLDWSGINDALSGVKEYRLYHGTTTWPACSGTPLYSGNLSTFSHTGLKPNSPHYYRLCTIDNAGNKNIGAIKSGKTLQ